MLRLGCEGVESQYRSVVWEVKKKEKNTFVRKEKKIREREETESSRERTYMDCGRVPERKESSTRQTHRLVFHKWTK